MCAVSMLVGAPRICSRFVCWYGFHEDVLDSVYVPILRYSDTVLCPGDNSIRLGRTYASRQNSATTNARSMSYRYTGVMLCQALCGVQRQLGKLFSLEQLVASLSAVDEGKSAAGTYHLKTEGYYIRRYFCTNHPVCCIVGGALRLKQVGSLL